MAGAMRAWKSFGEGTGTLFEEPEEEKQEETEEEKKDKAVEACKKMLEKK